MVETAEMQADQVEFWNGPGGARWIANQDRIDTMVAKITDLLIERAAVRVGESVIDIGCGGGGTTAALARLVGNGGHVIGVDVSAPILVEAAERLIGFPNVEMLLADAASYGFRPGTADLLFSRFGVMFFGDPLSAFANMRKALKPSGRMVFACWRLPRDNPWMVAPLEATYQHVPPLPKLGPEDPGPFSFGKPERVTRILEGAGFGAPSFEAVDFNLDLAGGRGLDAAVAFALEVGPSATALDGHSQGTRDAAAESMRVFLARFQDGEAVRLQAGIWIVSADPA